MAGSYQARVDIVRWSGLYLDDISGFVWKKWYTPIFGQRFIGEKTYSKYSSPKGSEKPSKYHPNLIWNHPGLSRWLSGGICPQPLPKVVKETLEELDGSVVRNCLGFLGWSCGWSRCFWKQTSMKSPLHQPDSPWNHKQITTKSQIITKSPILSSFSLSWIFSGWIFTCHIFSTDADPVGISTSSGGLTYGSVFGELVMLGVQALVMSWPFWIFLATDFNGFPPWVS